MVEMLHSAFQSKKLSTRRLTDMHNDFTPGESYLNLK